MAASVVLQQQITGGNGIEVLSVAATGGTLYITGTSDGAGNLTNTSTVFVPTSVSAILRRLPLTNAKSDLGVPMTATAGTPTGTLGVSRTAGTSLQLVGEATSGSAKTNKGIFEFNLPESYVAGSDIAVVVNALVTGSGTLTGASTTLTVAAYKVIEGVETALTVSAAVLIPATTAADLSFTITGTGLVAGQRMILELIVLVTSSSGANTGTINSVRYLA